MRWIVCEILEPITKKDRLGNKMETGDFTTYKTTRARYSPWDSSKDIHIEERDVTKSNIALTLPVPLRSLPSVFYLRAEGITYKVTEKKHWEDRWTICRAEVYYADKNYERYNNPRS